MCITSLTWNISSSMVYLVNLKGCVPTQWIIFLISASCQSFSKPPILKLVVKHEKGAFSGFFLFVVLVFSFNVAILKLSCSYAVMKCLTRSLYKTIVSRLLECFKKWCRRGGRADIKQPTNVCLMMLSQSVWHYSLGQGFLKPNYFHSKI